MLGKKISRYFKNIFLFFPENRISHAIYTKCPILLSGKNKQNITHLSSAEFAHSVLSFEKCCLNGKPCRSLFDKAVRSDVGRSVITAEYLG